MRTTDADLLTFVFTFHLVDRVLRADGDLGGKEAAWMAKLFPQDSLQARGLLDDDGGLTPRYERLLGEAKVHLGQRLNDDAKAALIHTFFEGALADADYAPREAEMIAYACEWLGISTKRVQDHRA